MANNEPSALRKVYFDAWQKNQKKQPLSEMETIIVDIIQRHPEYHPIFTHPEIFKDLKDEKFPLDHNPFFHLALHVTIVEQVRADRPSGIRELYLQLLTKYGEQTETEHRMMECLAKVLMESFNNDASENDKLYLEAIKRLV